MERMIRLIRQGKMRLYAHGHVGGFDADHQIVVSHVLDDLYLIQSALRKSLRRDAVVFFHKFLFQGAAVDTDTDRDLPLFCRIHHGTDPVL